MSGPYYVAVYGGFIVLEAYATDTGQREKLYTVADARLATPFDSFARADALAKYATHKLYPADLRYFAILRPSFGEQDD